MAEFCETCATCCGEFVSSGLATVCCELVLSLAQVCGESDESKRHRNSEEDTGGRREIVPEAQTLVRQERTWIRNEPNQTADVWNISGRVNHEPSPVTSEPQRWSTGEHRLNVNYDSISPIKDRLPPPPYTEVDLPSYEQATGNAKPKTDLVNVHISPRNPSENSRPGTSS